jgi:tight adherence protein C
MNPLQLSILALLLLALALAMAAGVLLHRQAQRHATARVIQRALGENAAPAHALPEDLAFLRGNLWPARWLESRLGRLLVADEDRRLIDQCGLSPIRAQLALLVSRTVLALGLPVLVHLAWGASGNRLVWSAVAFAVGVLLPKWWLKHRAGQRRERVAHELPLFVDLLGLLQSVGLSLDQSLQVIASDFQHVMPVLGAEVARGNRQYSQGRTREQAYQRMAGLHDNQHLVDFIALVNQVDKHGGAIQEPIRQFSERLRVHRMAEMKARIGKITVKMTVVMVTTLLPALVIVTAGPGFLAIFRSVGSMTGS